ncbi:MAG: glycoside hydrolase family 5 protein [Candidatus Margulisiibacteriota bacterium]
MLKVNKDQIVDVNNQPVMLRGVCLGGWLNMENFITGYPGNESAFRKEVGRVLGPDLAKVFFKKFLDYFITESDIRFLSELGVNAVRLSFNYHHFEDDNYPLKFFESGFYYLDRALNWCKQYGIYVILDLHSAPGWQNPDWHCDNPSGCTLLWGQKPYQDRVVALWQFIARRYKDEAQIAGYDLLNEPVVDDIEVLNGFYQRLILAIREIDQEHIIFVEGNWYSSRFAGLDAFNDPNVAFSSHHYINPAVVTSAYLKDIPPEEYEYSVLEKAYDEKNAFIREQQKPCWVGEFGLVFEGNEFDDIRLKIAAGQFEIMNKRRDHWTLWTYKDIGCMGSVYLDEDSLWMKKTAAGRALKRDITADTWPVDRDRTNGAIDKLRELIRSVPAFARYDDDRVSWQLNRAVRGTLLSGLVLPVFAEQFKGLDEDGIDQLMKSFLFENCIQRKAYIDLLKEYLKNA